MRRAHPDRAHANRAHSENVRPRNTRPASSRSNRSRGAAAVEFALIMPLLILLVFGIVEFGRGYNAKITLTHAAREAVREYTISGDIYDSKAAGLGAASNLSDVTISISPCDLTNGLPTAKAEASWDLVYNIPLFGSGTTSLVETAVMRCGG